MGKELLGELLGTALLIILGNGVVAGVVLNKTKSKDAGWLVITVGWGLAVVIAAFVSGIMGPAHLNPAVTLGMALAGKISFNVVVPFIIAQTIGAMIGAGIVWLQYKDHYEATEDKGAILGSFATGPAISNPVSNFISEFIGTFVLVLGLLAFGSYDMPAGVGTLVVGSLIVAIGVSLGGTTGYAINPARDFGPRLMHQLLPITNKGDSDWGYAWIPIVAPLVGGIAAAVFFGAFF